MEVERATILEAKEILTLQKVAYRSGAEIYNDFHIPPLTQTLKSIGKDFGNRFFLKAAFSERVKG